MAGPFKFPPIPGLHVSSFGVIPKGGQPGQWRLIVDLSSPPGASVNDGIDPDSFSLQYIRVDNIIDMVGRLGPGALMAKFDVQAALRNVAVHPTDRVLLGMKWRGNFYVDLVLPFGLRSAPSIFDSIASVVEWILRNNYNVANLLHYLDDFITCGPPASDICGINLATALRVCSFLGLPLHPEKCVGPSTTLVVLGIELDSVNRIARLPDEKLSNLKLLIQSWAKRHWCRKKELESLIGHLHHAAKVVWPGRTFIRRMINLLACFRDSYHPIRLNAEFQLDLNWWKTFLTSWHGVSFWLYPGLSQTPSMLVTSDASGSLGYGAYSGDEWFNGVWTDSQKPLSIAYKELFPVVIASHIWGHRWAHQHVLFRSDNEAVVAILKSRTSKISSIMKLLRSLLLVAAQFNFSFSAEHVPGVQNGIADALSRFHWQVFHRLAPWARRSPSAIPGHLLQELSLCPLSNEANLPTPRYENL